MRLGNLAPPGALGAVEQRLLQLLGLQLAEALAHFEQAYMVYEKYFSIRQQHENSVLIADAAMQVAIIMEDQNPFIVFLRVFAMG